MSGLRKYFTSENAVPGTIFMAIPLVLLFRLGYVELRGEEARRALVAMEMMTMDSWIVPLLHGLPYLNKPPVYMWILSVFFSGPFVVNEFLIRLPGVLSGVLTAGLIYWVSRHWLSKKEAAMAGVMFLTGADFFLFGMVFAGEIDPFYALLTFGQMAILFLVFTDKRPSAWLWFSFFLGAAGILTKGLPSLAHQALSVLALVLATGRWKILLGRHFIGAATLFILLPVFYFLVYDQYGNAQDYVMNLVWESVKKSGAVSKSNSLFSHLFIFPFSFLYLLLPWSLILFLLARKNVRRAWLQQPEIRSIAIILIANLIVYWLSPDTRNRYLYPFLPWLTLLITPLWAHVNFKWWLMGVYTMLMIRVIYGFIGMPMQQAHFKVRDSVKQALELTGKDEVRYLEKWSSEHYSFVLPAIGEVKGQIRVTPSLHYKIPYYFMSQNHQVVRFDTLPEKGIWYITRRSVWPGSTGTIYYVFPEKGDQEPLVLGQLSSD